MTATPTDFSLSMGTYATLTGEFAYWRLEIIASSFEFFAITSSVTFKNWVEAWEAFWKP